MSNNDYEDISFGTGNVTLSQIPFNMYISVKVTFSQMKKKKKRREQVHINN